MSQHRRIKSARRPISRRMDRAALIDDRQLNAQERAAQAALDRYFTRQLNELMSALRGQTKAAEPEWLRVLKGRIAKEASTEDAASIVSRTLDGLINWDAHKRKLESILRPIWTSSFDAGAQAIQDTHAIHTIQKPELTARMLNEGFSRIDEITDTTRNALAKAVAEGVQSGEGINQLATRVREHMPHVQQGRARVIATTEAHTSMMSGKLEQMQLAGIRQITWMTRHDGKVRSSHQRLHGETIPYGKRFSNGLRHPGDTVGPPEEIINCRCTVVPADY